MQAEFLISARNSRVSGRSSMSEIIRNLSEQVSRKSQQIMDYQSAETYSIMPCFKKIQIYSHNFWLIVNALSYYSFINFIPQWLSERDIDAENFNQIYEILGYFNLSLVVSSVLLGYVVDYMNRRIGFQKSFITVKISCLVAKAGS